MSCRWSRVNPVDQATVTGASVASLPGSNVQTFSVSKVWRLNAASGTLDIDFGAAVAVDVMAFVQPNDGPLLAPDDTVRWTAGTSAGGSDVYDSGDLAAAVAMDIGYHVHRPAAAVTARYLRLSLASAGLTHIDIGRVWAGADYVFSQNFSEGFQRRWLEATTPVNVGERSFVQYGLKGAHAREYRGEWPAMTEADKHEVLAAQRALGTVGQVLFTLLTADAAETTILARMTELDFVESVVAGRIYSHRITLLEQR